MQNLADRADDQLPANAGADRHQDPFAGTDEVAPGVRPAHDGDGLPDVLADAYARLNGLGVACVTYGVGGLKVANTTAEAFAEMVPVLVIFGEKAFQIPASVWGLLVATGFFEALYYVSLAKAYRYGEMSIAYPLARAFPVLFVAFFSELLGRGERISSLSLAGMLLVFRARRWM